LEESEAFPIAGSEGVTQEPFFAPDGKWIAFVAGREMKRVSLEGGSPQVLCQADFPGGAWGPDGTIIYTPTYSSGLWRMPSSGGAPEKLTEPEPTRGELGHWWPQLLPDGENVLFTNYSTPFERCSIAAYSLKSHRQKVLVEGAMFGRYLRTGYIVFARYETLLAAPFDLKRLEMTGSPVPVLDDLAVSFPSGSAAISISDNGTLAYIRASSAYRSNSLVRLDRKGNIKLITDVQRNYETPKISPDGQRIAVTINESDRAPDIWTYDLERGTFTRITFGAGSEGRPIWTHDGRKLIFQSEKPQFDLHWKAADGTGAEEPLLTSPFDKNPGTISRDGKFLIYSEDNRKTASDLWVLPLEGDRKPRLWLQTLYSENEPSLSPDGHWLAYVSDESRRNEIYVQPFPGHGERIQVSVEGGTMPVWTPNGRELLYYAGGRLMAVPVTAGDRLKVGKPAALFNFEVKDEQLQSLDISPDGTWFVGVQRNSTAHPVEVEVVLNWLDELKQRVPLK
jgi:Tol biopolymer transport system component